MKKRLAMPLALVTAVLTGLCVARQLPVLEMEFAPGAGQLVDQFEAVSGVHPGFRRNHAKGLCISGEFRSNGNAASISVAHFFKPGVFPVIGRLSIAGSDPAISDASVDLRSLALAMSANGQSWKTSMNSVPVFPVSTPEALIEQLRASVPAKTVGNNDPGNVQSFRREHLEAKVFRDWLEQHPPSSGFHDSPYYSVNAFRFVDEIGRVQVVRWSMEPETPYGALVEDAMRNEDPDRLSHHFATRLAQAPVRWRLIITLAGPGDASNDATQLWPPERQRIDAGVLVVDKQQSQIDGLCRDVDFNPLVLPPGIHPSDDPVLLARGAVYAESHKRRLVESALQSADRSSQSGGGGSVYPDGP
jgi:catalase